MLKNILFIHQSADLYGSDRVLLSLVKELNPSKYCPIVLLPCDGPLLEELKNANIEVHIIPIAKLSRSILSVKGLLSLPLVAIRSIRSIDRILKGRRVSLVHSNTLAILSGALWSRWRKVLHVWHVHEIIVRPRLVVAVYSLLLRFFADTIVCNSYATETNLLARSRSLEVKSTVVWNGLESSFIRRKGDSKIYREQLGINDGDVLVALVGRINSWKGQQVLVSAANLLFDRGYRNIRYLIVGSPPSGQGHFLDSLKDAIELSPAKNDFILRGFIPDIWQVWEACDIAVIPSTEPEPFGMVALEAMSAGKPVIAANHGGLTEIVSDRETGFLVDSQNKEDFALKIRELVDDENLRKKLGREGELRYLRYFTLESYITNMEKVYESSVDQC